METLKTMPNLRLYDVIFGGNTFKAFFHLGSSGNSAQIVENVLCAYGSSVATVSNGVVVATGYPTAEIENNTLVVKE
jgi:hypothetical protein